MSLKDSIRSDVAAVFFQDFAETIKYYPRAGGEREILAIVDRDPPGLFIAGNYVTPVFVIDVSDHATEGVLLSDLDTGGDQVGLTAKTGDVDETRMRVIKRLESDLNGMIKLELR